MQNLDRVLLVGLFAGYVGKLLLLGANYPDVGICLVLGAAHYLYNKQLKDTEVTSLRAELAETNKVLSDRINALDVIVSEHRTHLTSIKVSQGIRTVR